jgi:M6 family metalloprotease-like protein
MVRRFSFCHLLAVIPVLLATSAALAIVPPRPGSDARLPAVSEDLLQAGFGRVSRPVVPRVRDELGIHSVPTQAAAAATGVRYVPVLLGDTADRAGTNAAATLEAELFGTWPSGSMTDYYQQVSYGQFAVTGDVYGWYRLPQNATYYEGSYGCNGLCSWPQCAGRFVYDLIVLADAAGVDWGQYDNDGPDGIPNSGDDDGYVDTVFIVHSGDGGECGGNNHIWSHSFFLAGWGVGSFATSTDRTGGGKIRINDYVIQPEESCSGGLIEIGVFCHEYGHALGLPDLYDTSGDGNGIGNWGVMGAGSWGGDGHSPAVPVHFCAWSKCYLGWLSPTVVTYDGARVLPAVESTPSVLKVWTAGTPVDEYFLIENRRKALNDVNLPQAGLNIWHVDETIIDAGWSSNEVNAGAVYGVALEEADGLAHLINKVNRGDAGDPWPGSTAKTVFGAASTPGSHSNAGAATQVAVSGIPTAASSMSFQVAVGAAPPDLTAPGVAVQSPNGGEDWAAGGEAAVTWLATDDRGVTEVEIRLSLDGGKTFPDVLGAALANTGTWNWTLPATPAGNLKIQVRARDEAGNWGGDVSDGAFAVSDQTAPGVMVSAPAGGEVWNCYATERIEWAATDNVGVTSVDIFLSLDDGVTWPETIATGEANDGQYDWEIPVLISTTCRVKVVACDAAALAAEYVTDTFTLSNTTPVISTKRKLHATPPVPNPFNPTTEFAFENPCDGHVQVAVYDLAGRRVRTLLAGRREAGLVRVRWNGRDGAGREVGSGVYYFRITAGGEQRVIRATMLK